MKFFVYKDAADEWRWRLVAGNNRIIATSGEGYRNREDCIHGIQLIQGGAGSATAWDISQDPAQLVVTSPEVASRTRSGAKGAAR